MTISIDASVLTAYYNNRAGLGATATTAAGGSKPAVKDPTPPWSATSTAPRSSDLVKSVLAGARFIDPNAAKLDAPTTSQSADYKSLFALYQGLNALEGLTEQAQDKKTGATQLAALQRRFASGLGEVQAFLQKTPFTDFGVAEGAVVAKAQTKAGVRTETDEYATKTLYTGTLNGEAPALQGDVRFSLKVAKTGGGQAQVDFDLADLGSQPRTLSNVVIYLNDKLAAAGLTTRFANVRIAGQPTTSKVGGQTVTLPAGPDQYALKIKGTSTETLSFSAPDAAPAVYVAQTSGVAANTATGKAASAVQQLLKLNADPAVAQDKVLISQTTLSAKTAAARATAAGPDGSLFVLADVTGNTPDGQTIRGPRDVALTKYDSAGNVIFTRTLGASGSASGYALSVSPDGTKVAVAGAVTGALDGSVGGDVNASDSFVSVYDAKMGEEQWTQRRGALADDRPTSVSFGADGSVYVAGTAGSAVSGGSAVGGQDAYLQGFAVRPPTSAKPAYSAVATFTQQFGTTGVDRASGVVVSGNSVITAGVENGHAVVRRYDLQPSGAPVLAVTRDLGDLQGGDVAGVAVGDDGSIIVAGSTHNGALEAGTITSAYDGGRDGFVAKLSGDLTAGAGERLSYVGGAADRSVSALTVSGGKVYLAGQTTATPPAGQTTAADGFALSLDADTGAVGWSRALPGIDATSSPASISVSAQGASSLDKLGLPTGTIDFTKSPSLVANTSVRVGDQFVVTPGAGRASKTITIDQGETYDTLAAKIASATGFAAKVQALTVGGVRTLKITPSNDRSAIELRSGPSGRDALSALGLSEGLIQTAATAKPKVGDPQADGKSYGLGLSAGLQITDLDSAKKAQAALLAATSIVRGIYSGAVPAYLTGQIANYQAALNRLTGGS